MSRIVIENGIVYTGEALLSDAAIVIDGATIAKVAAGAEGRNLPREAGEVRIDAGRRFVTPGLVNAHTHIYSALARGIALKEAPPSDFLETLERLWWRLDRALTLDDIALSASLHGIECLKSGVTTVFDHHASQKAISGSLRTISDALEILGLRACLCFEVSDRDGPAAAAAGIEENRGFLRECARAAGAMRRAKFGMHASFTLSDETLSMCRKERETEDAGFHIHVAEGAIDQRISRERHGQGVIDRLKGFGILGRETIAVHGVHLEDREIETLASSGSWHAHCPQSNMNNAVGAPDLSRFRSFGVRTALGTDGFTANLFRESLAGHLLQSHEAGDPRVGYKTIPDLLLRANAELAREAFGVDLGRIRSGAPADIVVWDYDPPTPLTTDNLWGHVLFGLVNARAAEVLIAGRRVLVGGRPVSGDEEALAARCRKAAAALWERF